MVHEIKTQNKIEQAHVSSIGKFFIYISFILVFPILLYIATRNTFLRQQQRIEETASGIEVQLKKRFDLLTKLIDSVKESMKFETNLQKDIVALRNQVKPNKTISDEKFAKTNSLMDNISRQLQVTLENYPDLKSVDTVVEFQKQAGDVEANIAAARRFYNTSIRQYNQRIITYPTNVAATALRLSTKMFFEINLEERKDLNVKFT